MKKAKSLLFILGLCLIVTGCTKEPENSYLGNLKVTYSMEMNGTTVDQTKFEFYYGRALTKYLNQMYENFDDDYASVVNFKIEDDINALKDQDCTITGFKDKSWEYYFSTKAKDDLQEVEALVAAAKKDGYKVNDADKKKAKSNYGIVKEYCKTNDLNLPEYLRSTYGLKATKETMIDNYQDIELATRYAATLLTEPTDEEVEAYYSSHKDDIDTIDLRYFAFNDEATAKEFASEITTPEDFKVQAIAYASDEVKRNYQDNDASLRKNLSKTSLPEYLQEVMFDQTLPINSVKVVAGENSYDVVMLIKREQPTYRQASISTIYLDARENDSDTLTQEKIAVCKSFAENLLTEFKQNTDKSIDKFHEYNSKYADDKNNQGDYNNISKQDSTQEIASWVFDDSRVSGDMNVLASNYGYTIVYFREFGGIDYFERSKSLAKDALYDQKLSKLKKNIKVKLVD